jgi:hypothetical protein
MASVTIRIEPNSSAKDCDFEVSLIEEDGRKTSGELKRSTLTTGEWRVAFYGAAPEPPARDILNFVSNIGPALRSHPDLNAIAETLYAWLLPDGPIRQRWPNIYSSRIYLQVADPTLERLPWEMACPANPPLRRPALIGGIYRLNPQENGVAAPIGEPCSEWPFRILVVIGCLASEEVALGVDVETRAIERAFHAFGRSVDVNCMIRPRERDLKDWIRSYAPHVLHFVGHSEKAPGLEQYGLRIESDDGGWTWFSEALDTDLLNLRWCPKLVVLNACRSSTEQGGWSALRSFMTAGAKAAIGMQADVNGSHSAGFAAVLYRELAAGARLEDAVFEARATMPGPPNDISWALPAMWINQRNVSLFTVPEPLSGPEYEKCAEFDDVLMFANCRDTRRVLTDWAFPCRVTAKPKNFLLLFGEPTAGKSHVVKWAMENWAICGARVRYLKLSNKSTKKFLSVLRLIRDGDAHADDVRSHFLHAALPTPAFKRFNWHLNNLTQSGVVGEWSEADHPEAEIADELRPLIARSDKRPEEQIGAMFVEALGRAAADKPLILVLDQLQGADSLLPGDEFQQLLLHVLLPAAASPSNLIKIAVVATHGEAASLGLTSLPPKLDRLVFTHPMTSFDDDAKIPSLVAEMIWFQREDLIVPVVQSMLKLPINKNPPPRGLARLEPFKEFFEKLYPNLLVAVKRMQ